MRKKIQRISKSNILFLDETHLRVNACPNYTLVAPGEHPYVIVDDTTQYAKRYDMIACCTSKEVFPSIIYSPTERKDSGVKGINTKMLITYIQKTLAPAAGALDRYPLYCLLILTHIVEKISIMHFIGFYSMKNLLTCFSCPNL